MRRIKVLIVAGPMQVGGIENQLMHLLRKADKEKYQIDFTTTVEHPFYEDEILSLDAKCIHLPKTNGGRDALRYCAALYRVMKEGQYDVVHSHELFHSGMVLLTARLAGVRCRIAHAHSCNQNYGRDIIRKIYHVVMRWLILHNATAFLACSTLAGEFLYGKKTLTRENYHLVVNSVDTTRFLEPLSVDTENPFTVDGWKNVIQVGRFSSVKNFLFTTEIAKELKNRGEKVRFLCVGNDGNEYEKEVRKAVEGDDLQEYMVFLGVRKDVDILMKQADAFILPSKYEGMPLTLIEAQASGLNCVAADTFSHEVDFGIGTVSWLKLGDGAACWADAVCRAADSPRVPKAIVEKAIADKRFDSRMFAETLCEIYANG